MDSILRAFASEQIQIIEANATRTPEQQKLIKEKDKIYAELEQRLDNEEVKLMDQLLSTNLAENVVDGEEKFIWGYRLGVLMMIEVLAGQSTFFLGEGAK